MTDCSWPPRAGLTSVPGSGRRVDHGRPVGPREQRPFGRLFYMPDQDGRSADRLVSSTRWSGCGTPVRRRRNGSGRSARDLPLPLYARSGRPVCGPACEFHTGERLWNSSPSAAKQKRDARKGHPSSAIRPAGLVTWAVLWTAAVRRTAREFRFRVARNSDRLSPVRRRANAGPEGPASSLRPAGLEPVTSGAAVRRSNPLSYGRRQSLWDC